MATLDPRLLELVETLVAVRLDWLAFEMIDRLQIGLPLEETEEALAAARSSIQGNAQPQVRGEPQAITGEATQISPDEQIEWAAAYVQTRLGEALDQFQESIDVLDLVVNETTERSDKAGAVPQAVAASAASAVVVLLDVEGEWKSGRNEVTGARASVPTLRAALAEWVAQTGGQATTR